MQMFGIRLRWTPLTAVTTAVGVLGCIAVVAWPSSSFSFSADGRVWKAMFYEQFAIDLSPQPANCLAREVGAVTRLVGPLLGERPDDTPGSVWRAIDLCLDDQLQNATARAIALGGWSFEEPPIAPLWDAADELLGDCIRAAGGWQAIGSFDNYLSTCQSETNALTGGK